MRNFGYIILGLIFLSGIIFLTEDIPELLLLINLSILGVTIYMTFSNDVKFTRDRKIFYTFLIANAFLTYAQMNDVLLNFGMRNIDGFRFYDSSFSFEGYEALRLRSEIDRFVFRTGNSQLNFIFNYYEYIFLAVSGLLWYKYNEKTK